MMLFSLTVTAPSEGRSYCSLSRPQLCTTTNDIVWDHGFQAELRDFTHDLPSRYYRSPSFYAQARDLLGGPPDHRRRIGPGRHLFTACRPHSCDEKGAVVVNAQGQITARGLLVYDIPEGDGPWTPLLLLYLRQGVQLGSEATAIKEWASRATSESAKDDDYFKLRPLQIEVFRLQNRSSKTVKSKIHRPRG